jgi:hypothetical protein
MYSYSSAKSGIWDVGVLLFFLAQIPSKLSLLNSDFSYLDPHKEGFSTTCDGDDILVGPLGPPKKSRLWKKYVWNPAMRRTATGAMKLH